MKKSILTGLLLILFILSACAPPAVNTQLTAPNVFLRGVQSAGGVRYAATFIKPAPQTEMQNVQVEITLPANVALIGLGVPRQVSMAEIRQNGLTRTLAWHIPSVSASQQMDVLSFSVPLPLPGQISFSMRWQDSAGVEHLEQFDESPPLVVATESEAELLITESGYQPMGNSGVRVSAPVTQPPLALQVRVLPASFNPPAEFGALWWCSLAEMDGVPAGQSVNVVVPLRRPIAPFTQLALFQQNGYGSWSLLPQTGTVTADGLSVAYAHPGGLVASGGEQELQPAQVDLQEVKDGTSNTVAFAEAPSQPDSAVQAGVADGANNTIIISEAPPAAPPPANDGAGNTVIVGEATAAPPPANDGTSNTVIVGEATAAPPAAVTESPAEAAPTAQPTSAPTAFVTAAVTEFPTETALTAQPTSAPTAFVTAVVTESPTETAPTAQPTFTSTPEPAIPTLAFTNTPAAAPPGKKATSTPRPTQVIRIVTSTPPPPVLASPSPYPTRTPAPTLSLPIVAYNAPAYLEVGYEETGSPIRVVIIQQGEEFLQCQSGGLICAPLLRTPRP